MKKWLAVTAAMSVALATPVPAHAVPDAGVVREITVELPGLDGCTFTFTVFSDVKPVRRSDGTVDVVERGSFKVTGVGRFCEAPVLPTEVHIYDRSPGLPTYYTSGVFGAAQVVEYLGVADIAQNASTPRVPRTNGVVAIEFRAPLIGVCLMDLYAVASPGVAAPVSSFVPCPVVEP